MTPSSQTSPHLPATSARRIDVPPAASPRHIRPPHRCPARHIDVPSATSPTPPRRAHALAVPALSPRVGGPAPRGHLEPQPHRRLIPRTKRLSPSRPPPSPRPQPPPILTPREPPPPRYSSVRRRPPAVPISARARRFRQAILAATIRSVPQQASKDSTQARRHHGTLGWHRLCSPRERRPQGDSYD